MLKISDLVFNLQPRFIIWVSTLPFKIKNEENRINANYQALFLLRNTRPFFHGSESFLNEDFI